MLNVKNENVRNVTEIFPKTYLGVFVHKNPLFLLGLASIFISVQIFLSIIMMSFIEKQEN